MLSPRESASRERTSLDGLWRFALDAGGVGRAERWWAGPLPGSAEMPVPASFNDIVPTHETRYHVGDVWYQRMVRVPRGWDGQRIVVRFDAATHRATVWVGDALVGEHEGGYTPFEFDVSEHARPGEAARVTVVVNNELSWESIPPGYVEQLDDGRRVQQYFHDFFNYAGLHRSAWLYATPRTYLSDVTITTTEIDDAHGSGRLPGGRRWRRRARAASDGSQCGRYGGGARRRHRGVGAHRRCRVVAPGSGVPVHARGRGA